MRRAFAFSLADVNRLSGTGLGFPNLAQRVGANDSWWWTRTPVSGSHVWYVSKSSPRGQLVSHHSTNRVTAGGVRPALIIINPN